MKNGASKCVSEDTRVRLSANFTASIGARSVFSVQLACCCDGLTACTDYIDFSGLIAVVAVVPSQLHRPRPQRPLTHHSPALFSLALHANVAGQKQLFTAQINGCERARVRIINRFFPHRAPNGRELIEF